MYMYTITHMDSYHFLGFPLALNSHGFSVPSATSTHLTHLTMLNESNAPNGSKNGTIVDDYTDVYRT